MYCMFLNGQVLIVQCRTCSKLQWDLLPLSHICLIDMHISTTFFCSLSLSLCLCLCICLSVSVSVSLSLSVYLSLSLSLFLCLPLSLFVSLLLLRQLSTFNKPLMLKTSGWQFIIFAGGNSSGVTGEAIWGEDEQMHTCVCVCKLVKKVFKKMSDLSLHTYLPSSTVTVALTCTKSPFFHWIFAYGECGRKTLIVSLIVLFHFKLRPCRCVCGRACVCMRAYVCVSVYIELTPLCQHAMALVTTGLF